MWGLVIGVAQAATPLAFWWLVAATVYALGLGVIASIYIGFAQGLAYRTPAEVARTWKDLEDQSIPAA
jgi:hypothetical protein